MGFVFVSERRSNSNSYPDFNLKVLSKFKTVVFFQSDDHMPALFKKIQAGIFEMPLHVNPEAADLIRAMLTVNPLTRATTKDILYDFFSVQ